MGLFDLLREGAEMLPLSTVVFFMVAGLVVASAAGVALSRNIIYSAFSLLFTFGGVAALYAFLSADFLAVIQVMVYVGGILVLILFAVMLTNRISDVNITNRSTFVAPGIALFGGVIALLLYVSIYTPWNLQAAPKFEPTTAQIGDAFLTDYLLPFEIASIVLLAVLIAAVVVARKEMKTPFEAAQDKARAAAGLSAESED